MAMKFLNSIFAFSALFLACSAYNNEQFGPGKTCVVNPGGNSSVDDAPAIIDAFSKCGHDGKVVFLNQTYHVNSVMNTTGLQNCQVDLQGTLLVSLVARTACIDSDEIPVEH
jgi:hypothetical protein